MVVVVKPTLEMQTPSLLLAIARVRRMRMYCRVLRMRVYCACSRRMLVTRRRIFELRVSCALDAREELIRLLRQLRSLCMRLALTLLCTLLVPPEGRLGRIFLGIAACRIGLVGGDGRRL